MPPRVVSVAIPFRLVRIGPSDEYTTELLMVSSRKHPHRFIVRLLPPFWDHRTPQNVLTLTVCVAFRDPWQFPKGGWEEKLKETLAEAAVREAGEEGEHLPHLSLPFNEV